MSDKKYGVLPPTRTVRTPDGVVATGVIPGYSMEEFEANLLRAGEALVATLTPEERAEYERRRAERKKRRRRGR
jgi:hypothetical protein